MAGDRSHRCGPHVPLFHRSCDPVLARKSSGIPKADNSLCRSKAISQDPRQDSAEAPTNHCSTPIVGGQTEVQDVTPPP